MNNTITVPDTYIRSVSEMLDSQRRYFDAAAKAKISKLGTDYQEAKDFLREAKALEAEVRKQTDDLLGQLYGKMTAADAIAALRDQVDGDLDEARKGVSLE